LTMARDLYASAAYEEALSELARGKSTAPTPAAALEMDAYRAFCLVALGRSGEAETIAESLVRTNPMFTVDGYRDVSPRIADLFTGVRKRLLPQLIREEYRTARVSAVQNAPDAESRLTHVHELLGEAKKIGAWDDTLADMSLLVDGFRDLARRPAAAVDSTVTSPRPNAGEPLDTAIFPTIVRTVFGAQDGDVVPPVVLSEARPVMPIGVIEQAKKLSRPCTIQVLINERGAVEQVTVRDSVNSAYDSRVVDAARKWRYQPATRSGTPVKYVKIIAISPND